VAGGGHEHCDATASPLREVAGGGREYGCAVRRILAAIGGTLFLLLLPACGTEAGPSPAKQAQDPGPEALAVKLDALMTDGCYRDPALQDPPGCEKYVTQLGSVPGTAQKYAGTTNLALADAGRRLDAAIATFRDRGCAGAAGPDCTTALRDMATSLRDIDGSLAAAPTGG